MAHEVHEDHTVRKTLGRLEQADLTVTPPSSKVFYWGEFGFSVTYLNFLVCFFSAVYMKLWL